MPSFPAFVIKIKIKVSAKLTFHPYKICQVSTNINFNFNYKIWETGHYNFKSTWEKNKSILIFVEINFKFEQFWLLIINIKQNWFFWCQTPLQDFSKICYFLCNFVLSKMNIIWQRSPGFRGFSIKLVSISYCMCFIDFQSFFFTNLSKLICGKKKRNKESWVLTNLRHMYVVCIWQGPTLCQTFAH